ncbi:Kdo domain containing protein [Flavobacterium piscinae]|uniref:lipopolysaccharide kinase InaA family protein n=1 Tax=Flavobacterium piscinae TaxID=2506424 RepID=UPI00198FA352|nr:lipopolysaccharide kinase InaA family protein [Flavobacterium piscinae]MBC8884565.1 Kdo domain containing protein [Flavobacterium piscinae]
MKKVFRSNFNYLENQFDDILNKFKKEGNLIGSEKRNIIKFFDLNGGTKVNVKSFKKPNFINALIYGYIRKSKARRSFEYATILQEKGIGTPQPFAYFENISLFGLRESYYFSEQQEVNCELRKVIFDINYPEREIIFKQLAQFFYKIHNFGIEFIDNTAGNTLVKKVKDEEYYFYLVDLNRMAFHDNLTIQKRASNLAKLTNDNIVNELISDEYSRLMKVQKNIFSKLLQSESDRFLNKFNRRKNLKKKLFFGNKT